MESQNPCVYQWNCSNGIPSQEHILPDFLGCPLKLPKEFVCDQCNERFNQALHLPLRKYLLPILVHFGITTKKTGQLPSRKATLTVDGKKEKLVISKERLLRADPSFSRLSNGGVEFIARTEKEFDKKSKEILSDNSNFILKRKEEKKHPPPEEETIEQVPPTEILYRNFAQMAVNCLLYWFGRNIVNIGVLKGLLSLAKGENSDQKISMVIKKDITLASDSNDVCPVLIATFILEKNSEPNFVKINLFEYICAKVPLGNFVSNLESKYFVINAITRKILCELK